ncbi:hypothetical protein LTR70_001302 [Exophiala xenobiotica]|uniref:Dipeptidyl-peptidase V n=1 Tax=Lithohypha guttulata TaxID=1690604 RepID=A0ABR0KMK7_9EURO|nr:hypothetical protein LTR24_000943 [Lithohypha guttulata]KAK5327981.1 hypothetical protein LTR70_001302 [Exophiala xenobiotica]
MPPTEVTPEVLADLRTPQDTRLSPDGKYVVYALRSFWVRQKDNITASLWLAEVGKENSARQITQGNYHDSSPMFSPDGKYISFLSDRAKPGKASALYLMPVNGGEALPQTSTENEKGVDEYKWCPDGDSIAFSSPDEDSEEKKKRNEAKDDAKVYGEDWPFGRLRVIDVKTKEVITLWKEEAHVAGLQWSPDGKQIAFNTSRTPELDVVFSKGGTIRILDVKTKHVMEVCTFAAMVNNLCWQGEELLWVSGLPLFSANRVYHVSATTIKANPSHLAYGENNCAEGIRLCGDLVVVYVQEGSSDQLRLLESDTLFSEEADIGKGWDAVIKDNQTTLVVTKGTTSAPEEVFSMVDGKCCQLSNHNKQFANMQIGEGQAMRCKADDGLDLEGVICVPRSLIGKNGPHPSMVLVHGGPYGRVTLGTDPFFWWPHWLLSLGYVVLMPNYRGSSARGAKFAETVHGAVDASYDDVIAMTKHAIKEGIIDEKRVAIGGWSQGGFISFLAVTRDLKFHFKAAIAGAGVTDWDTMAETSDVPTVEKTLGGSAPWEGKHIATKVSPIFGVKNITTPLLILHGENDERVPKEQGIGFHRGMKQYGKECELVMYPREGHGIPLPFERAHHIDMLKRVRDFLAKHLKC